MIKIEKIVSIPLRYGFNKVKKMNLKEIKFQYLLGTVSINEILHHNILRRVSIPLRYGFNQSLLKRIQRSGKVSIPLRYGFNKRQIMKSQKKLGSFNTS